MNALAVQLVAEGYRRDVSLPGNAVPSEALALVLRDRLTFPAGSNPNGITLELLAERSGVWPRKINGILRGEYAYTRLGIADALLVAVDRVEELYLGSVPIVQMPRQTGTARCRTSTHAHRGSTAKNRGVRRPVVAG